MAYKLIGKNFTPPDVRAKVTGKAKYAEDFRADGMAFCKLLLSPIPSANISSIDASEALAMKGVYDVLTADDVPQFPAPYEQILTNKPRYEGQPILAVAAVDETTAADAIDKIKLKFEPLPFVIDPLKSLEPGGPNAFPEGNVFRPKGPQPYAPGKFDTIKWTAREFAEAGEGKLPEGKALFEWSHGDLDAGFAEAALVLDESFVNESNPHHSMEPRTAFSYWENGKCFVYGSTQSQSFVMPALARFVDVKPEELVYIAEFCGGGFGSKGTAYSAMSIPAHMSKKIGKPVMMRISRAQEYHIGSARGGFQGRIKLGFRKDGRITAADLFVVQASGAILPFSDYYAAGEAVSLVYTPLAMRWRGLPVMTNTPPCGPQRGPGQNQMACTVEPLLDKAARKLGIDRLAIREINAPDHNSLVYGEAQKVSSSYMREALRQGAEKFKWQEKKNLSGKRSGSKVTGVGVGQAYHSAGFSGFDGLVRITPDGKLHIHSGVGNLGTYSYAGTSRVVAEVLDAKWENCIIERGDSRKHLPWNLGQFGSNTSFTMTRSNYAAAMDAKAKLQELAAMELGGKADDYDVGGERVFAKADPKKGLSFAEAAKRAIEKGGKFDGHELPKDIFFLTKESATAIAGTGLVGVARDNLPAKNHIPALATGFMTIELDLETGKFEILDYVGTIDCGTVIHPLSLSNQIRGGAVQGIGLASLEKAVYDPQNGLPANVGLYQSKPPSYLDVPSEMQVGWVDQPDPDNPVGTKGMGEPVMGCAASALICAIGDALSGVYFNRSPISPDMILNHLAGRAQSHAPLAIKTQ